MFNSFSRIDKNTLKIAIPLIISNITIPLVGFVDNVMMGHLGSMVYLGAIGVGSIIISYILFSFGFIKSLTTGFVSQHTGSSNTQELLLSLSHLLLISSFISFLIILFRDQIIIFSLNFMNASSEVNINSKIYLDYRIWSIPAIFLRDILIGYYIGVQKIKAAIIISITVNLLNIILDYYFIYILNYSIEGVAIASLISEYSVVFFILYAIKNENIFKNTNLKIHEIFDWLMIKKKILVNMNMFLRSFILMTIFIYFMKVGASYGDSILAANAILLNFFFLFSYGIDGFAHSSEVLVGNSIGKKDNVLLKQSIYSTGKFSVILASIYLIIFNVFDLSILQFVTNLEVIHAIVLSNITYLYLIFISATVAFWLDGVFIGSLKVTLLRNIMIISGILFFFVETILLQGNNDNLWVSFLVFFTARSMLLGIALHYHMKNNRFITI
ncbi:MAG: MATE family efflux transporter [Gammaproteobacteria bacterium]|nr:MATE family efflux transporter [Gammaproteobacteria bacterium]